MARKTKVKEVSCVTTRRISSDKNMIMIQRVLHGIAFDIANSSLPSKEKDTLFQGIVEYYYYDTPLSVRNRKSLWKVREWYHIKFSSIRKMAIPPNDNRKKTANKKQNKYGKRNQL